MTDETPTDVPETPAGDRPETTVSNADAADICQVVCDHIDARLQEWIPAVAERVAALIRTAEPPAPPTEDETPEPPSGDDEAVADPRAVRLADLRESEPRRTAALQICKDNAANDADPGADFWESQVENLEGVIEKEAAEAEDLVADIASRPWSG